MERTKIITDLGTNQTIDFTEVHKDDDILTSEKEHIQVQEAAVDAVVALLEKRCTALSAPLTMENCKDVLADIHDDNEVRQAIENIYKEKGGKYKIDFFYIVLEAQTKIIDKGLILPYINRIRGLGGNQVRQLLTALFGTAKEEGVEEVHEEPTDTQSPEEEHPSLLARLADHSASYVDREAENERWEEWSQTDVICQLLRDDLLEKVKLAIGDNGIVAIHEPEDPATDSA